MKALMVALMLGAVATPAIAQKTTTPRAEAGHRTACAMPGGMTITAGPCPRSL